MTSDNNKDASSTFAQNTSTRAREVEEIASDSQGIGQVSKVLASGIHKSSAPNQLKKEVNGPKGLEPTRYGDWEANGRCYDF